MTNELKHCPACKETIAAAVVTCPACGAKQRKPLSFYATLQNALYADGLKRGELSRIINDALDKARGEACDECQKSLKVTQ
jgi:hypothetical protein